MTQLSVSSAPNGGKSQEENRTGPPQQEFAFGLGSPVARQEKLLFSEYLSDVVFKVGSTGQLIHAHKLILTVASEVFYTQFNGGFDEARQDNRQNPIAIEDIEPEVFKQVLRYIYCQKVDLAPENVMDVYCASEKYMLPDLQTACDKFLATNLNVKNVLIVFNSNRRYGFENVDELCLNIIQDNPIACFQSDTFLTLCKSALELIAACRSMNCQKDQLCSAIRKWCEANDSEADIVPQLETIQCEKLSSFSKFRYQSCINTHIKIKVKGKMYLYGLGVFIGTKMNYVLRPMLNVTISIDPGNVAVARLVSLKKSLYVEEFMFEKITIEGECRIRVNVSYVAQYGSAFSLFCLEEFAPVDTLGALELTIGNVKAMENVSPIAGFSFSQTMPVYPSIANNHANGLTDPLRNPVAFRATSPGFQFTIQSEPKQTNCVAYLLYGLDSSATCSTSSDTE